MATNQPSKESTTTTSTRATSTADGDKKRETSDAGYTITIPSLRSLRSMRSTAATEVVEPKHLVWFGALAVAGAAGVIEWPVIAAVGIGSIVAERFARAANRSPQSKE